ncbi:MAG: hypothetical protein J6W75_08975 [Bacteroidaceae bacterium]|nr:hypothetical protein [Bacteroidaceae bacterium]
MKKYLFKIAFFFAFVAIIDVACGFAFRYLTAKAKYGETYNNNYIANVCVDDVIILGSSHADRHYVPSVIQDSLGLSCYNCGEPGCGIIPAYARYKMITERKKPQLVIYEATPGYDYFIADDYSKYLGRIRQYSDREPVADMYETFGDELEPLRLLSNMYRNNSNIVQNLMDIVVPTKDYRGYGPLFGKLTEEAIIYNRKTQLEKDIKSQKIDSLKLSYVEKLFADVKADGVCIVCTLSPYFMTRTNDKDDIKYLPVIELCRKYNIPFIDNRNYEGITGEMEYFQDFDHLNDNGAKKYTSSLIPTLRKYLEPNSNYLTRE